MQKNQPPPQGKRLCEGCNKYIGATNYATHVKRMHADRVRELCPRVALPAQVAAQVALPAQVAHDEGAEDPDVAVSENTSEPEEEQALPQRHKLLQFTTNTGEPVPIQALHQCCDYGTPATCIVTGNGYSSRQLVTPNGSDNVSVRKMHCRMHNKYFREINPRSTHAAEVRGYRLSEECFEIRKVLYARAFLMLIATTFIITGSVTQVARLVAATHGGQEFAFEYTEADADADLEERDDDLSDNDDDHDSDDPHAVDRHLASLRRKLSILLTVVFRCFGPLPSPLNDKGILEKDVVEISIDFTYKAAAKIRLPKSALDNTFVGISANVGTIVTATKKCLATRLCPRGEGTRQLNALIDSAGIHDRVTTVYVDNADQTRGILQAKLGPHVLVCGDRFHLFRLMTVGIKMNDPDRGKLFGALRKINDEIVHKQIVNAGQLRAALTTVCDRFSARRDRHAISVPKSRKLDPMLCRQLLHSVSSDEARQTLERHGAYEVFPPLITPELKAKWVKKIEDDQALNELIGNPDSLVPAGTNVNENLHGFLNSRLRGFRICGYDLFLLSLNISREIWNVLSVSPSSDKVMYFARLWNAHCLQGGFWKAWKATQAQPPKPVTLEDLNKDMPFKVVSTQRWTQEELVMLEDFLMGLNEADVPPGVSVAELVASRPQYANRTAADVARKIQGIVNSKLAAISAGGVSQEVVSQATHKRGRSPSLPRALTLRDRVIATVDDIPCEHLQPGVFDRTPVRSLVIVTARCGRQRSTGIGLVAEVSEQSGLATTVDYYKLDNKRVESGTGKRMLVPPMDWELVGIRAIPRQVPLE